VKRSIFRSGGEELNTSRNNLKESLDVAETEDKISLKKIIETEREYQIKKTKEKIKYQNNYKDRTEISNCRS
jgi:hypothetical protein